MDYILRQRAPTSAHDAQVLRERRADDRREDFRRYLSEEETHRLNNSWYSKQQPVTLNRDGSPSTTTANRGSPRPYGTLSDINGEPLDVLKTYERGSPSPAQLDRRSLSRSPTSRRAAEPDDRSGLAEHHYATTASFSEATRGPRSPAVMDASPRSENEYVSVPRSPYRPDYRSISQRKSREFSGSQVAQILSGNGNGYQRSYRNGETATREETADYSYELQIQMQAREEEERRRRLAEEEFERQRVRETLEEARRRIRMEDERNLQKQQEADRMLREGARLTREAHERARARELEEEAIAKAEREEMERKRQLEMRALRERMSRHVKSAAASGIDPVRQLVDTMPKQSPLREAVERLLEVHADELDEIAPIVRDILNEPEFAVTQWF